MITFQKEGFLPFFDETAELFKEHYEEVAERQDVIELDPDLDKYKTLFDSGFLEIHTAREDGKLIGYSIWIVSPHLHYKKSLTASSDIIFIHPAYRKGMFGVRFIKWTIEEVKKSNPQRILLHVKPHVDFGPILERMGATFLEKVYSLVQE